MATRYNFRTGQFESYDPYEIFREPVKKPRPLEPSGVGPTDIGFYTDPKTGVTEFAGPGAAKERELQAEALGISEQERVATRAAARAEELTPAIISEIGKIKLIGDIEKDKLSYEQAIKSALATAGAGAVGTATVAGAAGLVAGPAAPVTVPVAAGLGAIAGAVGGFLLGFKSNLQAQRKDMLKGEAANLMKQEQNMLKLIMETNKYGNYPVTLTYFNAQMSLAQENYGRLKAETTDDLSLWLGEDGHKQLEKYETFYSEGGMRDILVMQMNNAVAAPDPSKNDLLQTYLDISEKELGELEE